MSLSQLDLINGALIKLGAYKITALNDGSTEADIASALYTPVRDALLSAYPWSFATITTTLSTPSATEPTGGYTYAFDLPVDHLRTISAGAGVTYRQLGKRIETNDTPIDLTYIMRVAEVDQAPYFDLLLMGRLAAEFCVPLTENAGRAEALYKLSDAEVARARGLDAQQDTPSALTNYTLIDVRG